VWSERDRSSYPKGVTVTGAEMESLNPRREPFHGDWNYCRIARTRLPSIALVVS
jgi:hypothetical protein